VTKLVPLDLSAKGKKIPVPLKTTEKQAKCEEQPVA
jgi:hypothetical protein